MPEQAPFPFGEGRGGVAITDDDGTLISEQRYLPFGGVRQLGGSFITQTDYGYTGQRDLGDMGLMDYKARFYSPILGRFVQPDTIVPGTTNPQAWNRYAYTQNNPVNFNDPTGHNADCGMGDRYCQIKPSEKMLIQDRAGYLSHKVSDKEIDDLEAFASLADYAVSLTPDCTDCIIDNLGAVVTGHSDDDEIENYADEELLVIMKLHQRDHWFIDSAKFAQSGFADIFKDSKAAIKDGGGNQAFHFFYYVQVGYQSGPFVGNLGVDIHEDILGKSAGKSEQDRYLGYEGVKLGVLLQSGDVSLSNLGDYIRENLSPGSATAQYYEKLYDDRLNQNPSYQR